MGILALIKNFLHIRNLNVALSGKKWYGFSVKTYDNVIFIELLFASGQKLYIETPQEGSNINRPIFYLQSILDAWKNPRINGFHIYHYVFKNKLTIVDRQRERKIISFALCAVPAIKKRTP